MNKFFSFVRNTRVVLAVCASLVFLTACQSGSDTHNKREKKEDTSNQVSQPSTSQVKDSTEDPPTLEVIPNKINVFVENSGSIDGYIKGSTNFEAMLSELLANARYHFSKEKVSVNFINKEIYPIPSEDLETVLNQLEPTAKTYNVGDRASSKLNDILDLVLKNTETNDVSVFISDCIYSLGDGTNNQDRLLIQKGLTKDIFAQRLKKSPFATLVLRFESQFNGKYYNANNQTTALNAKRPYYVWLMGRPDLVQSVYSTVNAKRLAGYTNEYSIQTSQGKLRYPYKVLRNYRKLGDYGIDRQSANTLVGAAPDRRSKEKAPGLGGIFQFAVGVNLKHSWIDPDYLSDQNNYESTPGYSVSVSTCDDPRWKKDYTHILTLKTDDLKAETVVTSLKKHVPKWVSTYSTDDDSNISTTINQTFGFNHLVQGVAEAYNLVDPTNKDYFQVKVNVKR